MDSEQCGLRRWSLFSIGVVKMKEQCLAFSSGSIRFIWVSWFTLPALLAYFSTAFVLRLGYSLPNIF